MEENRKRGLTEEPPQFGQRVEYYLQNHNASVAIGYFLYVKSPDGYNGEHLEKYLGEIFRSNGVAAEKKHFQQKLSLLTSSSPFGVLLDVNKKRGLYCYSLPKRVTETVSEAEIISLSGTLIYGTTSEERVIALASEIENLLLTSGMSTEWKDKIRTWLSEKTKDAKKANLVAEAKHPIVKEIETAIKNKFDGGGKQIRKIVEEAIGKHLGVEVELTSTMTFAVKLPTKFSISVDSGEAKE